MRNVPAYLLGAALGACLILAIVPRSGAETPAPKVSILQRPMPPRAAVKVDDGGGSALPGPWHKTKASFYGDPYDDGRRRVCADGKTVYKSDGAFCAAWTGNGRKVLPLGAVIEVRRGKVTMTLTVTDRQRYARNRWLDLPTRRWDRLGAKRSAGVVAVEWRRVK